MSNNTRTAQTPDEREPYDTEYVADLQQINCELLEALKTLVRRIERDNLHTTQGVQLEPAKQAIQKAEGRG